MRTWLFTFLKCVRNYYSCVHSLLVTPLHFVLGNKNTEFAKRAKLEKKFGYDGLHWSCEKASFFFVDSCSSEHYRHRCRTKKIVSALHFFRCSPDLYIFFLLSYSCLHASSFIQFKLFVSLILTSDVSVIFLWHSTPHLSFFLCLLFFPLSFFVVVYRVLSFHRFISFLLYSHYCYHFLLFLWLFLLFIFLLLPPLFLYS